ncbi:LytTR family DNA-binding domain-containing protein [Collinsella sp. AGMB00827]|uniref:LytTR family DNA-binding domain-containing protein n=1 Tax=Collinsella ureilytica TaxID=2869515 RepID=A0ABS7MLF1_9ACTN|nr:LytTR family DNA-binding domain-containing protein [Collinsella urealyticum]MBY4798122.1 LytTR family DNA-binding domain-containing protein [Collinsella urealyticum]
MTSKLLSVLIVDDEPPIRAELRYLLEQDSRIGEVAEAGNGTEAVEHVLAHRPDVLFLDIQMPGMSGIKLAEALKNLRVPPAVVFVTAFSEHAVDAFELDAVDYILKPVESSRLAKALDRVAIEVSARRVPASEDRPRRLAVERGATRAFIPVSDICYVEARTDYSAVMCPGGEYLVNESISGLERRLAPDGFLRVHRSYLVNVDDIHDIEVVRGGLMELRLDRIDAKVPVSRRRAPEVKARLGIQ